MSASEARTLGQFLKEVRASFIDAATSELDVALLVEKVTGWTRLEQIAHEEWELSFAKERELRELIRRRKIGTPVAYLTERREFWGLDFKVNDAVLIPRPETEHIVELCACFLRERPRAMLGLDCGTGSGCIAISILHETRKEHALRIVALDISQAALRLARENARAHGVIDALSFLRCSWCDSISAHARFDFIVGNPPYIAEGDPNLSADTRAEPRHALFSGPRGTEALEQLIAECAIKLAKGGAGFFECGATQGEVLRTFVGNYPALSVKIHKDYAGHDRVVEVRKIH